MMAVFSFVGSGLLLILTIILATTNLAAPSVATTLLQASDPRVDWGFGRVTKVKEDTATGSVTFDWLGVSARIAVVNASFVGINATCSSSSSSSVRYYRCTRLKSYIDYQDYMFYPLTQVWVNPDNSTTLFSGYQTLWQGPSAPTTDDTTTSSSSTTTILTVENMIAPQYTPGSVTSIHDFVTDGIFVEVPPHKKLGGPEQRRMEFVGDSITAATNVIRPIGAPECADWQGYQSDWSQTYEGLLCHTLGAACSTIAVGGKCIMRECESGGGLQMPDYYRAQNYQDAPTATFQFRNNPPPDVVFINLGTNDRHTIDKLGPIKGPASFIQQTVEFMVNVTNLYHVGNKNDIHFFLNAGPIENITKPWTQNAIKKANDMGLNATFVDTTTSCAKIPFHQPVGGGGGGSLCDGCAGHPGIEAHYQMYLEALPVIQTVMGWW